jgi:azurin
VHLPLPRLAGRDFYFTVHRLGAPLTDIPGWKPVEKRRASGGAAGEVAVMPVPWEKGEPGRELRVPVAAGLQFGVKELRVKRGERISLTLENPDIMPHNWVLVAAGGVERTGALADAMVTAADAVARHFVPPGAPVLVHTGLVAAGTNGVIHFNAPEKAGRYPYLCTFPGHWRLMQGEMVVE